MTTTKELQDAVGVTEGEIITFIKQGKIPKVYKNLTYPCESCHGPIRDGRLCRSCKGSFQQVSQQLEAQLARLQPAGTYKTATRRGW
ncbi:hypothetical protein Q5741_02070 [Paenibacillus sp. JX-17]|uniref:Uncharacterized protein n=1 Tax=Paenibacillus lacisoli TaxID=3064525 RepID=A0ABT9C8G6_9BACL|nr:hypothetical protein [Paenibacillus sp. JX-17]MDO7905200.1 hypothetical protein [Paenibacillus sp. JX-17]